MNRAKAIDLLEKLRLRTTARGATEAEALQAATLAEKIIKRYGLDEEATPSSTRERCVLNSIRPPRWTWILALAFEKKFGCETSYTERHKGRPAVVVFVGAEHQASVACWLFRVVANELHERATREAREIGTKGGKLVQFRNEFLKSACWEVYRRLNPPKKPEPGIIPRETAVAKPKRQSRRKARPMTAEQMAAFVKGSIAGREVSLDTNVIGNKRQPAGLLQEAGKRLAVSD